MAIVYGEFNPADDKEPFILNGGTNTPGHFFSYHDIHSGKVIMAKSLGEAGAEIYQFDDLGHDTEEAISKIGPLLLPENVSVKLLPWFKSEPIPVRLDNGEEGDLTIQHFPMIKIQYVRFYHDMH